ncbi:MAG: DinB superfamily protein [Acidobacteria bacterium]|nr:DinB superfamily protein [Acidobacteriota bacterium]
MNELSELFARDLTRLIQEIEAFGDSPALWQVASGITNSAGNLALHLDGNLREFVGRQIGGVAFARQRDREFSDSGVDLLPRLRELRQLIPPIVAGADPALMHPHALNGRGFTNGQFLMHLYGHFSYHLGQIDYARRMLTGQAAVPFAQL